MLVIVTWLFPAGAGMNPVQVETAQVEPAVPRRRGDEPAQTLRDVLRLACSPQARG